MGTKQSKGGSIAITLDQPFSMAGEYVKGKVHLDIKQTFFSNELLLVIDGKQYASADDRRGLLEFQNTIYANYMILHQFPNRQVLKGQYTFPFTFSLETHIPGTFKLNINKTDLAHIRYFVKVELTSINKQIQLRHSTELIVRELNRNEGRPSSFLSQIQTPATCCVSSGLGKLKIVLDKNVYISGTHAILTCNVDNMMNPYNFIINAQLIQVVTINGENTTPFIFRDVICSEQLPEFRKKMNNTFVIKIPLLTKKEKPLEPSTSGRIIDCKYHIEIDPKYSACCTTETANNFILPLTIQGEGGISVVDTPVDWQPTTFEAQLLFVPNRDSFIRREGKNPYIGMMEEDDQFR